MLTLVKLFHLVRIYFNLHQSAFPALQIFLRDVLVQILCDAWKNSKFAYKAISNRHDKILLTNRSKKNMILHGSVPSAMEEVRVKQH